MKRIVGKYKDEDITISVLHLTQTYGGLIIGNKSNKSLNMRIVDAAIKKEPARLFGLDRPYYIVKYSQIEYDKPLPPEIVYAWLSCSAPIKEGHGSHLFLIWLQESDQDPFAMAVEHMKTIVWEKEARDFNL